MPTPTPTPIIMTTGSTNRNAMAYFQNRMKANQCRSQRAATDRNRMPAKVRSSVRVWLRNATWVLIVVFCYGTYIRD